MSKQQALSQPHEIHANGCKRTIGPKGGVTDSIERWRPSGKCKTWKTRPAEFSLPVMHGLYAHGHITHENAAGFHVSAECPLLAVDRG